jgi:hypothetical protein
MNEFFFQRGVATRLRSVSLSPSRRASLSASVSAVPVRERFLPPSVFFAFLDMSCRYQLYSVAVGMPSDTATSASVSGHPLGFVDTHWRSSMRRYVIRTAEYNADAVRFAILWPRTFSWRRAAFSDESWRAWGAESCATKALRRAPSTSGGSERGPRDARRSADERGRAHRRARGNARGAPCCSG